MLILAADLVSAFPLKNIEIKLDGNPLHRYDVPNKLFYNNTLTFIKMILKTTPRLLRDAAPSLYHNVVKRLFPVQSQEIAGIAKFFNFSEQDIFIYQFLYETYAFCTSIVAALPNGTMIHGRNLDYDFLSLLSSTHYMGVFTRGGKEVFRCTLYGGFIGVNTCFKSGKFMVSLNQRTEDRNSSERGLAYNIQALQRGHIMDTWGLRLAFESQTTYADVVHFLSHVQLVAPVYYIVSGPGKFEGCVITRKRGSLLDMWEVSENEWFLVQVNTDHWKEIPLHTVDRRTPAMNRMKAIGRTNMTLDRMMNEVLRLYPNTNSLTLYNSFGCALTGNFTVDMRSLNETA